MFAVFTAMLATALGSAPAPLDATPQTRLDAELRCLLGVYALGGGKSVTVTGTDGQPRALSFTLSSGRFGALEEQKDGSFASGEITIRFAPCKIGAITLKQGTGEEKGTKVRLAEKETTFTSDGISLHGKLVLPAKGRAEIAAVWIEGSNNDPTTDDTVWQYELARRGIATFVYDKRGTGASGGGQTSDFQARARDTVAAVKETRRLSPSIRRIGVVGGSQGGWVAPLTATMVPLDFVIPAFAMAEGPIAQDKALVELQLRKAGFDDAVLKDASTLTAITERIVRSNMLDGLDALDVFKAKHAGAHWLEAIQPRSYTGLFLRFPTDQIKLVGPSLAQGLSFDYEPRPIVESITPRQLWLLGGDDQQAPNAGTQTILREIQKKRSDVSVVMFPKADHGLVETVKTTEGTHSAFPANLFDITASWIKRGKLPASGQFIVLPAAE